jgi:hypothetical protein
VLGKQEKVVKVGAMDIVSYLIQTELRGLTIKYSSSGGLLFNKVF